eukprot:78781-Prymnesium_polylepis.1
MGSCGHTRDHLPRIGGGLIVRYSVVPRKPDSRRSSTSDSSSLPARGDAHAHATLICVLV